MGLAVDNSSTEGIALASVQCKEGADFRFRSTVGACTCFSLPRMRTFGMRLLLFVVFFYTSLYHNLKNRNCCRVFIYNFPYIVKTVLKIYRAFKKMIMKRSKIIFGYNTFGIGNARDLQT